MPTDRLSPPDFLPTNAVAASDGLAQSPIWMAHHRINAACLETPAFEPLLLAHYRNEVPVQYVRIGNKSWQGTRPAGSFALLPPETSAELAWETPEDAVFVAVTPTFLASIFERTQGMGASSITVSADISFHNADLAHLVRLFYSETRNNNARGRIYVESLALLLGVHLLQSHCHVRPCNFAGKRLARRELTDAVAFIHDNLGGNLSLSEVAAVAGYSPYHFHRLFRQTVGKPLHEYVIAARVEKAASLLACGAANIAAVAAQVGFADQTHLSRHCKRLMGVTPGNILPTKKARFADTDTVGAF